MGGGVSDVTQNMNQIAAHHFKIRTTGVGAMKEHDLSQIIV
jgi:hypothetical protein